MDNQPTVRSNPFPENPVATDSIEKLHDYRGTKCYFEAEKQLEIYREQFFRQRTGMAVGIRGAFGSGKTHLVLQLLDHLQRMGSPPFKLIRTTVEHADFKELYVNNFARKIEADDLKNIISLHYRKLVRGKVSDTESDEADNSGESKTFTKIAKEEVDRLADNDNPQGILQLIRQDLLPIKGLPGELDAEIAEIKESSKGLASDFFVVYSKITDPIGGPLAQRWLQGEILSDSDRNSLGLETRGIENADYARDALKFLLGAFKKAGYGVVFCLDEFERFAVRGTQADKQAASGLLKDLAEIFKSTGHVLIISGVTDAWKKMPEDVFDRIKRADIIDVQLSEEEAKGVLKAYVRAEIEEVFDEDAIKLLIAASELNARRLLTISYYAYQAWGEGETPGTTLISSQDITQATDKVLSDSSRVENAERDIRAVADTLGLGCESASERGGTLSGVEYDFLLGDLESRPVVVKVTRSIFKLGEVQSARAIAASSRALKTDYPQAQFCIIVIGYSTQEVRNELAKVVDRVFYYDEEKFQAELREFVSLNVLQPPSAPPPAGLADDVYKDLDKRFDQLEKLRHEELEQIKQELERLRAESARAVEAEREKRVRDKMSVPLSDLKSLLRSEEELGIRGKSSSQTPEMDADKKLAEALDLLDKQRSAIKEAEILNEKLPYEKDFSRRLRLLSEMANTAEELWNESAQLTKKWPSPVSEYFLDDYYELNPLRQLFRERRDVLSALEALHTRRVSEAEFSPFSQMWQVARQLSLPMLSLIGLSFLGVVFFISLVNNAWSVERTNRDGYITSLTTIKNVAKQIYLVPNLPSTVRGRELGQSLIEAVSSLDQIAASSASHFNISNQIGDITNLAAAINREIGTDTGPDAQPSVFPLTFHGENIKDYQKAADVLIYNCDSASSRLAEVSFDVFLIRFVLRFRSNPLYLVPLFPSILLWFFIVRRRREERSNRGITAQEIRLKRES